MPLDLLWNRCGREPGRLTVMTYLALALTTWGAVVAVLLLLHRREISVAWREPSLRMPVLILESDDWGPGPETDADSLARIAEVLERYQDRCGRHPVVTIGAVLAVPSPADGAPGCPPVTLSAERFRAVRERLVGSAESGILSLQLHCMEHYWPAALQAAARRDGAVARWLESGEAPRTESLPSHLQTRWADVSTLPSVALASDDIAEAVQQELSTFAAVFGRPATVAVPPTFVWDERVERAWANGGIRYVVTPGRRYVGRDEAGRLVAEGGPIYTGQRGETGVVYLVRDRYFEPALGHDAERALAALAEKTHACQPTLLEMHRFNFTGDPTEVAKAVSELDRFLANAVRTYPELRFLNTAELGEKIAARDPELVERRTSRRIAAVLVRLARIPRLRKLSWLTGLAPPAWLFLRLVGLAGTTPRGRPASRACNLT
jgi:hypothetical protein